jgi:hypothetical protein
MQYAEKAMQGRVEKLGVIIYTQSHKIVGDVHIMPAARLVDYLNSKVADRFIVVTDANVYALPEEQLFQAAQFLVINKTAITMVLPKSPGTPVISDGQGKETAP